MQANTYDARSADDPERQLRQQESDLTDAERIGKATLQVLAVASLVVCAVLLKAAFG